MQTASTSAPPAIALCNLEVKCVCGLCCCFGLPSGRLALSSFSPTELHPTARDTHLANSHAPKTATEERVDSLHYTTLAAIGQSRLVLAPARHTYTHSHQLASHLTRPVSQSPRPQLLQQQQQQPKESNSERENTKEELCSWNTG